MVHPLPQYTYTSYHNKQYSRHSQVSPGEGPRHPFWEPCFRTATAVLPIDSESQGKTLNSQPPGVLLTREPDLGICSPTSWPSARVRSLSTASSQRLGLSQFSPSLYKYLYTFSLSKDMYWFLISQTAQEHGFLSNSLFTCLFFFNFPLESFSLFLFIFIAVCVSLCVVLIPFWCGAFPWLCQYQSLYPDLYFISVSSLLAFLSPISTSLLLYF